MERPTPVTILACLLAAGVATTCDTPATRPSANAQPAAPAPRPQRFDPSSVALDPSSPEAGVRRALPDDPATALRLARSGLASAPSTESAGRLHWLAADAAEAADLGDIAHHHLLTLAGSDHPLAPWAALRLAEATRDEHPASALRLVEPLAGLDWPGRRRARTVYAVTMSRTDRADEAIPLLRALVDETPTEIGAATAGLPLAELLAVRDDVAAREEALSLFRRVASRAPGARVGQRSAIRADEVLATLPEARRAALREWSVEELTARANAWFASMNHERAAAAYAEVAERAGTDDDSAKCLAQLNQGRALLRQRDRARGAALMIAVAEACPDEDVRARARFHAGRALSRLGDHAGAITQYEALEREAPSHRLADDARLRAAIAADDTEVMRDKLRSLPAAFPEGDMRGEARFLSAWTARADAGRSPIAVEDEAAADARRTHLETALATLNASIEEGTGEHGEDIRGRARYWRARTLLDLGRRDEAVTELGAVARELPLSYYAQQSLARLSSLAPDEVTAIERELSADGDDAAALTFPLRDELAAPAFERAVELLRVGSVRAATEELAFAGVFGPDVDDDELGWIGAATLNAAGAHPEASRYARRRLAAFMTTPPAGPARHRWRIAYPRAYAPLVEHVAAAEGVPATFVRAIAREESAFDPRAVSVAHAYGLTQLIRPTADRFARELGLSSTPAELLRPETNLRLGAAYMGFLWERYAENPAVVPSAYNAGERAADRWLRARPDLPLDEWVEEIPYDETRRYTRRVLQTWGVYAWLDEGRLPTLSSALPAR
jgi:soluble lytic murein transglycosylase